MKFRRSTDDGVGARAEVQTTKRFDWKLRLPVTMLVVPMLASCGTGNTADSEEGPVKIVMANSFNTATGNLAYIAQTGEDCGVRLEATTVQSGGSTNQVAALLSGDVDVAVSGSNTIIDAISSGADVNILASLSGPVLNTMTLSKKAMESMEVDVGASIDDRLKALKGLTIAAPTAGSAGQSTLRILLESVGLDPDTDVTLVPIDDNSTIPSGLRQGTYDASFAAIEAGAIAENEGAGEIWFSLPKGDADVLDDYVGTLLYSSKEWVSDHKDQAACLQEAMGNATDMMVNDPEQSGELLKDGIFAEMSQTIFDRVWKDIHASYPTNVEFTEKNWNAFVRLFDDLSESDYGALEYDEMVMADSNE